LFCDVNKNVVILLLIGFYCTEHKEAGAQTIERSRYKYQEKRLTKTAEKGPKEMDHKRPRPRIEKGLGPNKDCIKKI
jgi:hypothetical protein